MTEMPIPSGAVIVARFPDGREVDVTEGAQAIYDAMVGSLDWGSDFFTIEDLEPMRDFAKACGFTDIEDYIVDRRRAEYRQLRAAEPIARGMARQDAWSRAADEAEAWGPE